MQIFKTTKKINGTKTEIMVYYSDQDGILTLINAMAPDASDVLLMISISMQKAIIREINTSIIEED